MLRENTDLNIIPHKYVNIYFTENNTNRVLLMNGLARVNNFFIDIWINIDGNNSVQTIIDKMHNKYPSYDKEIIVKNVLSILNYLESNRDITTDWKPFGET